MGQKRQEAENVGYATASMREAHVGVHHLLTKGLVKDQVDLAEPRRHLQATM